MFAFPQLKFNIKNLLSSLKPTTEVELKDRLGKYFPDKEITFTDSARSAFRLAIEGLGLKDSEVLIPAFLCNIFEPILKHYKIKPIWLDINLNTFNLRLSDIAKLSTPRTKAILVPHVFGLFNNMEEIVKLAHQHNLKIIEDCAHFPPGLPRPDSYGDCLIFSLPKFLPVINGGLLVSEFKVKTKYAKKVFSLAHLIKYFRLYPLWASLSEKFRRDYNSKNKLLPIRRVSKYSSRALNYYLKHRKSIIAHRLQLARLFRQGLRTLNFDIPQPEDNYFTYLSALVPENIDRNDLFKKLRKKGIFCLRLWHNPLNNKLPNTAEAARRVITFPLQNWFTKKDINKIVKIIRNCL